MIPILSLLVRGHQVLFAVNFSMQANEDEFERSKLLALTVHVILALELCRQSEAHSRT